MRVGQNSDSLNEQMEFLQGESWFFYWKISSSLWKSKIESDFAHTDRLIVPINWSLHHIAKDRFDFAQERPETNLKRLVHLAEEFGKQVYFIIPFGPCPFMINGGVPSHLANSASYHANLTPMKVCMPNGSLNQIYSYYDPNVFMEFSQFTILLGQYFTRSGIPCSIFSAEFGFFDRYHFSTFFEDWSESFEKAFFRYLKSKYPEKFESILNEIDVNFMQRELREKEFRGEIRRLYRNSIEEGLAGNFEDSFYVHMLNGANQKSFSHFPENASFSKIATELVECHRRGEIATSFLLSNGTKNAMLNDMYQALIVDEVYPAVFEKQNLTDESVLGFSSFVHFEVYDYFQSQVYKPMAFKNGLVPFLKEEFGNSYSYISVNEFKMPDEEEELTFEPIKYFSSPYLDEFVFNSILRMFMDGKNIILDRSGLDPKLLKRLELFLLENNLNVEKVNFFVEVHQIQLGHGRLTLLKSEELLNLEAPKVHQFWQKLISTFDIRYLKVQQKDPLLTIWRTRPANSSELNYEEIRRLTLVNTTSYRKKVDIELRKNFALKKVIGEDKVNVQHKANSLNIEVLPGGQVSFDIGVYS